MLKIKSSKFLISKNVNFDEFAILSRRNEQFGTIKNLVVSENLQFKSKR